MLDGKRVALDLSLLVYQATAHEARSASFDTPQRNVVQLVLSRVAQLTRFGALPVLVVDGKPPSAKARRRIPGWRVPQSDWAPTTTNPNLQSQTLQSRHKSTFALTSPDDRRLNRWDVLHRERQQAPVFAAAAVGPEEEEEEEDGRFAPPVVSLGVVLSCAWCLGARQPEPNGRLYTAGPPIRPHAAAAAGFRCAGASCSFGTRGGRGHVRGAQPPWPRGRSRWVPIR